MTYLTFRRPIRTIHPAGGAERRGSSLVRLDEERDARGGDGGGDGDAVSDVRGVNGVDGDGARVRVRAFEGREVSGRQSERGGRRTYSRSSRILGRTFCSRPLCARDPAGHSLLRPGFEPEAEYAPPRVVKMKSRRRYIDL